MSAGAFFFNEVGELLLVKPTYKSHWQIPGGVIEENESPRQGCMREVKEELGLDHTPERLLCVSYTPEGKDNTEGIHFIFLSGTLTPEQIAQIRLPLSELSEFRFCTIDDARQMLGRRASRRLNHCLLAIQNHTTLYLENEEPV
jgi:8-oxo-dGTP pyrophosphatase MutT (NUDIX family)